jgi:4-amino-4-deoxy-L-arabinose transferase-like glycosyltransferase
VNLVFSAVKNFANIFFAGVAVLVMLGNPGLIAITFHALTEAISVFLLSFLAWIISKRYEREQESLFWKYFLLPLALLAVIKPYFAFPFYFSLALFVFRSVKRKELRTTRMLFRVFIYCLPVLLQFGIMLSQFGKFKLSTIGEVTLRNYYYSKFYADKHAISYDLEAGPSDSCLALVKQKVAGASEGEMVRNIFSGPGDAFRIYTGIIRLNLISPSDLQTKAHYRSERLNLYSYHTNVRYFRIHQFMLAMLILFLWITRKEKEKWVPAFALLFFEFLIIGVSGISYWQGDRLVLPALPIWITLYSLLLYEC